MTRQEQQQLAPSSHSSCCCCTLTSLEEIDDRCKGIVNRPFQRRWNTICGMHFLMILLHCYAVRVEGFTSYSQPKQSMNFLSASSMDSTTRRETSTTSPTTSTSSNSNNLGYDFRQIAEYYDRRPWEVIWRLNILGLPLLGWYIRLLFDQLVGDAHESTQRKRGSELREHLVRSGSVALVKSGQALSLRPDLLKNRIWAEELGRLVDAVGSFDDGVALDIVREELGDLKPRLGEREVVSGFGTPLSQLVKSDAILSLFEFDNDNRAVASASIGQVYKARLIPGPRLEAAIGRAAAQQWGGQTIALKVQRPSALASASLDMYLLRRTAVWLSKWRGGDLPAVADQFGRQLFGELNYVREAENCRRFEGLYEGWDAIRVSSPCTPLTRKRVLVTEWVEGTKGPWKYDNGIRMVQLGLKCCVDQLMRTGLFHADPHRGNLIKSSDGKLTFIDFGMMADIPEEDRYGLIGLVIGLQNKDLPLVTENLLKLGFLKDTAQLDQLIPRLRMAIKNSTGGSGKASDMNFGKLQAELDEISRENVLQFSTPPFFTIIIRSLTILEGLALSVDSNFRLVRGAYPYVLAQLVSPDDTGVETPASLTKLLVRLLTVNGEGKRIEWERLRDFLRLAEKGVKHDAKKGNSDESSSRKTVELFFKFLTSKTGLFLKTPLVHEVAEAIDGMASVGEANLLRVSRGLIRPFPGGNGPVNKQRMEDLRNMLDMIQSALIESSKSEQTQPGNGAIGIVSGVVATERLEVFAVYLREIIALVSDERRREDAAPILAEVQSVSQMVAVEVLQIRGSRAMRSVLNFRPPFSSRT